MKFPFIGYAEILATAERNWKNVVCKARRILR